MFVSTNTCVLNPLFKKNSGNGQSDFSKFKLDPNKERQLGWSTNIFVSAVLTLSKIFLKE